MRKRNEDAEKKNTASLKEAERQHKAASKNVADRLRRSMQIAAAAKQQQQQQQLPKLPNSTPATTRGKTEQTRGNIVPNRPGVRQGRPGVT